MKLFQQQVQPHCVNLRMTRGRKRIGLKLSSWLSQRNQSDYPGDCQLYVTVDFLPLNILVGPPLRRPGSISVVRSTYDFGVRSAGMAFRMLTRNICPIIKRRTHHVEYSL